MSIRTLVSKNKIRYVQNGFDLDLSYITPRIVAMGFPSSNYEKMYRNNYCDVYRFIKLNHNSKYKVYNLCSERSYSNEKFDGNFEVFPFQDHKSPPFELILAFCRSAEEFLSKSNDNVIFVHCKAGKGRSGLMISCLLLYCNIVNTACEAIDFYGNKRTKNNKGVTIASQRRYVHYFEIYLRTRIRMKEEANFYPPCIILKGIRIYHKGKDQSRNDLYAFILHRYNKYGEHFQHTQIDDSMISFDFNPQSLVKGDITINICLKTGMSFKTILSFTINSYFCNPDDVYHLKREKKCKEYICPKRASALTEYENICKENDRSYLVFDQTTIDNTKKEIFKRIFKNPLTIILEIIDVPKAKPGYMPDSVLAFAKKQNVKAQSNSSIVDENDTDDEELETQSETSIVIENQE